jgi:hypothetical protein
VAQQVRRADGDPGAYASTGGQPLVAADTSATCRTVLVDVGAPGSPQYVLTQAQSFLVDTAGRACPTPPIRATPAGPWPPRRSQILDAAGNVLADERLGKLESPSS